MVRWHLDNRTQEAQQSQAERGMTGVLAPRLILREKSGDEDENAEKRGDERSGVAGSRNNEADNADGCQQATERNS